MYFGARIRRRQGKDAARRMPPVSRASGSAVSIGGGTDAHRVASYNPSRRCSGSSTAKRWSHTDPSAEETPDRMTALRLYTLAARGSRSTTTCAARSSRQVAISGAIGDYLTVPTEKIGELESVLTLVRGESSTRPATSRGSSAKEQR